MIPARALCRRIDISRISSPLSLDICDSSDRNRLSQRRNTVFTALLALTRLSTISLRSSCLREGSFTISWCAPNTSESLESISFSTRVAKTIRSSEMLAVARSRWDNSASISWRAMSTGASMGPSSPRCTWIIPCASPGEIEVPRMMNVCSIGCMRYLICQLFVVRNFSN